MLLVLPLGGVVVPSFLTTVRVGGRALPTTAFLPRCDEAGDSEGRATDFGAPLGGVEGAASAAPASEDDDDAAQLTLSREVDSREALSDFPRREETALAPSLLTTTAIALDPNVGFVAATCLVGAFSTATVAPTGFGQAAVLPKVDDSSLLGVLGDVPARFCGGGVKTSDLVSFRWR